LTAGPEINNIGKILIEGVSIRMAKKSITISSVTMAIIAIIAGVLILFQWLPLYLIVGIFLIVWGILALINR
jgi:uncharacterized membrane protein HdeD (DUF308 family)